MARSLAKDHDDKRTRILTIAAQQFAVRGYANASMAQVSTACGISKANIYHYYPSKAALLFDILQTYLSTLRDRVCGLAVESQSPADQLHAVTAEILLAYEGMDALHKIQTESLHLLPEAQQETLRGYQREMVRKVSGILATAAPDVQLASQQQIKGDSILAHPKVTQPHIKHERLGECMPKPKVSPCDIQKCAISIKFY